MLNVFLSNKALDDLKDFARYAEERWGREHGISIFLCLMAVLNRLQVTLKSDRFAIIFGQAIVSIMWGGILFFYR